MAEFIRTWLDVAILAEVEATFNGGGHMTKYDKISRHLGRITTAVSQFLGLIRGGQMLNGAICPCCRGVTPKHPAGGAVTMRIEEIAKGKTATELRPAIEAVHAVVCWNPSCEPAEQEWHLVPRPSRGTNGSGLPSGSSPPTLQVYPVPPSLTIEPVDHSNRSGYAERGSPESGKLVEMCAPWLSSSDERHRSARAASPVQNVRFVLACAEHRDTRVGVCR